MTTIAEAIALFNKELARECDWEVASISYFDHSEVGGYTYLDGHMTDGSYFDAVINDDGTIEIEADQFYFDNHGNGYEERSPGFWEWVDAEIDAAREARAGI